MDNQSEHRLHARHSMPWVPRCLQVPVESRSLAEPEPGLRVSGQPSGQFASPISKDLSRAASLFRAAALQGQAAAQCNLGAMCAQARRGMCG